MSKTIVTIASKTPHPSEFQGWIRLSELLKWLGVSLTEDRVSLRNRLCRQGQLRIGTTRPSADVSAHLGKTWTEQDTRSWRIVSVADATPTEKD